ncbi:nucleoid occlusion protein [Vallitalea sp.]|jgi:ParB family chromosome partitioning protein|uniref:nucleoid occlusion protein n=1 Tax=Vallitalea sp. TaxID=1882829 RepID=UPI0025FD112F|nr:nucleoid occlusion protein [Vallitalea sp.]MCT4687683.1 nucleoid occlusion protein [Vallitalea sp.]
MINEYNVTFISVNNIRPNPYQPRRVFDKLMLDELANSIKEFGIMQPISVRRINDEYYELIAGERRLRASKLAGLTEIPAIIIDVNDKDSAVIALVENLQRENLNYIEEAEGYYNLINDYDLTQGEVAKQVGKSQSTIANKLRLLKLSNNVKKVLLDNNLSERHARALLKLPNEELQLNILNKVVEQSLNVKKTEELIDRTLNRLIEQVNKKDKAKVKRYLKDIRIFTNTIKQAVDMMESSGIDIDYKVKEVDDSYEINIVIPMN